jgi:general secretion pathway protein K
MKNPLSNESGMALVLTLLVMGVIVAIALHFNVGTRQDLSGATTFARGVKAWAVARSGVNMAMAALHQDGLDGDTDTLREPWAKAEALTLYSHLLFDEGTCELSIKDHCGRININRLLDEDGKPDMTMRGVFERLLGQRQFGLEEVSRLVDALVDWLDDDDEVTGFGAEQAYYLSLPKPYGCKNGPLDSLEELLLVRGFNRELLYGTDDRPGIYPFITIYGDGRININTAPLEVVMSLSDQMDRDLAERLERFREDGKKDPAKISWYKDVPGMGHVSINEALLRLSSDYFEVSSTGQVEGIRKTVRATVARPLGQTCYLVMIAALEPEVGP